MKELFKSLLLIALTFSAIIMTKSIFIGEAQELPVEDFTYEVTDLIEYIRPQNYIFSFGDLFIKLYDDEYENENIKRPYETAFKSFLTSPEEFSIAKTDVQIWEEQSQRKSLKVVYPFSIDLGDLLNLYSFNTKMVGEISDVHISELLFVLNKRNTLYIKDESHDAYYRLTGSPALEWIDDIYNYVSENKSSENSYRTIENRYNLLDTSLRKYKLDDPNTLLTPVYTDIKYPSYDIIKEVDFGKESNNQFELWAQEIFGEDLSFVKKSVYGDESTIFMYGYGEKVFEINQDESLTYTVKAPNNPVKTSLDFTEGLARSIDQINKMGVQIGSLYLSDYEQIETANDFESIYAFNTTMDGIPYYNPNMRTGGVIEVRFMNTDLVRVKKDARIVTPSDMDQVLFGKSFQSIMNRNRTGFELQYIDTGSTVEASDYFEMALQEMSQLETKYMVIDGQLIPVWHIISADTEYFINLTTGLVVEDDE